MTRTHLGLTSLSLALLIGFAGCGNDTSPADGAQRVLEGTDTTTVDGTEFPVVVPSGSFTFTVSEPVASLPDDVDAPDDTADTEYVGIAWEPAGNAPEFGPVLLGTEPEVAGVNVEQGDTTDPLTKLGPADQGGTANGVAWVALDGGDRALTVEYDGLTQTFDLTTGEREPGPADGFYDDVTPSLAGVCPDQGPARSDPSAEALQYTVTCDLSSVASVPYVAGEGWVSDQDSTHLVFELRLTPTSFRLPGPDGTASYRVESATTSVDAGGEQARLIDESETLQGGWSAGVVVDAPARKGVTLDVERRLRLIRDGGPDTAPESEEVVLDFSVDLS